ncbi:MAG: hypothetical protein RLZZ399_1438 [Verrucomicrobiota bacterium]|jgi:sulfite dehydrogenase
MKKRILGILLACVASGGALASPLRIELPAETAFFKKASGSELVSSQCLTCHSAEYITTQPPLSVTAWQGNVEKMQKKFGASWTPEQVKAMVDYLTQNYGISPSPKEGPK